MKIAVVGLGIHGSCAAWRLAERGHEVIGFDPLPLDSPQRSSAGASRIVRQAYPGPFYTKILLEGHREWRRLADRLGESIYHEVGLLYFGSAEADDVRSGQEALAFLNVPFEILTSSDCHSRWGGPLLAANEAATFTPEAGWVEANRALAGVRRLAILAGAKLIEAKFQDDPSFDRILITAGPWIREYFPFPVKVTKQTYAYIRGEYHGPVWIESGPFFLYGFPNEPGAAGFKCGVHTSGLEMDPNDPDRDAEAWCLPILQDLARRRFGAASPDVLSSSGCLYTSTEDGHFRMAWADSRTLAVSSCSGHGFKFGPWMGGFLADLLEEKQLPKNWPEFEMIR